MAECEFREFGKFTFEEGVFLPLSFKQKNQTCVGGTYKSGVDTNEIAWNAIHPMFKEGSVELWENIQKKLDGQTPGSETMLQKSKKGDGKNIKNVYYRPLYELNVNSLEEDNEGELLKLFSHCEYIKDIIKKNPKTPEIIDVEHLEQLVVMPTGKKNTYILGQWVPEGCDCKDLLFAKPRGKPVDHPKELKEEGWVKLTEDQSRAKLLELSKDGKLSENYQKILKNVSKGTNEVWSNGGKNLTRIVNVVSVKITASLESLKKNNIPHIPTIEDLKKLKADAIACKAAEQGGARPVDEDDVKTEDPDRRRLMQRLCQ